jgi:glycosyltransferase involved in cell wall biosynthesis
MITVTILTKNSSRYIAKVLQSLQRFDEVLILDTGSTDNTLEIVKTFPNVVLHTSPFIGFGPSHNLASSLAKHDWILSLDSDEIASSEFVEEVLALSLNPMTVYTLSRHNYYRGKFIKGCGWYPDRVVRLYNRTKTQFSEALVHEAVISTGMKTQNLLGPIFHYPYNTIDDFLNKMQQYSTLFAKQYQGKKKSSVTTAIGHGLFAFLKSYFLKKGILLGSQGFEISAYNGITAYYKYLKLRDLNSRNL